MLSSARDIQIFASLTRRVERVSQALSTPSSTLTVLAPLNTAMTSLERKPWEDARDYDELGEQAYQGASGEERAQTNLVDFVQMHVVPKSPWLEGEKVQNMGGHTLWWVQQSEGKFMQPGNVQIHTCESAANGELWRLRGVIHP